jgi:hypothetical protein
MEARRSCAVSPCSETVGLIARKRDKIQLADRVLDPAIARIGATAPRAPTDPWRRFESALDALLERANIAALNAKLRSDGQM